MNNRIDARLAALVAEVERRRLIQEESVDDLSQSLFNLRQELAGLDERGKLDLLDALNTPSEDGTAGLALTLGELKKIIENFTD